MLRFKKILQIMNLIGVFSLNWQKLNETKLLKFDFNIL